MINSAGFSQEIKFIKIQKSNSGSSNNIEIIANIEFGSHPAGRINYTSNIANDTLYLSACYFSGNFLAHSYLWDTIRVGIVPSTVRGLVFETYGSYQGICGSSAHDKKAVAFIVQNSTGISDVAKYKEIELYPNPVSDFLYIAGTAITHLNLYDLRGRLAKRYDFSNQNSKQVSVTDLPPGFYFVDLIDRDGTVSRKRLVKN